MNRIATVTWPSYVDGVRFDFEAKVAGQSYYLQHYGPEEGWRRKSASKVDLREELAKGLENFACYIRNSARMTDEEVRRAKEDDTWGPPEG